MENISNAALLSLRTASTRNTSKCSFIALQESGRPNVDMLRIVDFGLLLCDLNSRSSTVVIAYLMEKEGWNLLESFKYVRLRRKYIYPNLGFWELLIERNNKRCKETKKCTETDETEEKEPDESSSKGGADILTFDILDVHAEKLANS